MPLSKQVSNNAHLQHLLNSYTPLPIQFSAGNGVWLFDRSNKRYLDLIGGMGATILGHAHPAIIAAIDQQSKKLLHVSNLVEIPEQAELAKLLIKITKLTATTTEQPVKMFFTNSGAEAVETALKLTRLYGRSKNIANPKIVVMADAYHGRTLATLSASGNPAYQQGFAPLVDSFIRIKFNDLAALETLASKPEAKELVAVLLEPIQGEAGVKIPAIDYLPQIKKICEANNWLMLLDEVQTGIGRTGKMFCYQHTKITPDLLIIAKGLANGIPIGACMIKQPYADLFTPKSHGSTFGGNPLACRVAITTLHTILEQKLPTQAAKLGKYFLTALKKALAHNPNILAIRGQGLMLGIEFNKPCAQLMHIGLKHGLLFNVTRDRIIRMLPPLIITKAEIDFAIQHLVASILEFEKN